MIVMCSWCNKFIKYKWPYSDKRVTHSMCDKCAKQAIKDLNKEEDG